jgi:EXPERA (EXPanded EBP superfamily)
MNLPLRDRRIDVFFAVVFCLFATTSALSDWLVAVGVDMSATATNALARANNWYAADTDPLLLHPPLWLRMATGLSAFVYGPFYLVLAWALIKGKNWIQLPAVIYATMIISITGFVMFPEEFFGDPALRVTNTAKFLAFNTPYVLMPFLLLLRMRAPNPFHRKF